MNKISPITWLLIVLFLVTVFVFSVARYSIRSVPETKVARYGITFSVIYTEKLGLDVQETYRALVEDIGVRMVRVPVPWSDVEFKQGTYNWDVYDWIVKYSEEQNVKLTLVVGEKVPRWPECFVPDWAESIDKQYKDKYTRSFIKSVVDRYKYSPAIERWQIENEPLFPFGACATQISLEELEERVDLVRSLDTRPIQLTVSGELGPWKEVAKLSDILGISMYRKTWNDLYGYFVYPIGPDYYQLRALVVKEYVKKVIVSELQAEPWFSEPFDSYSFEQAYNLFTQEHFQSNLDFVKKSGVSEASLWGAEWWYYLKTEGDDRLWNVAKDVFTK